MTRTLNAWTSLVISAWMLGCGGGSGDASMQTGGTGGATQGTTEVVPGGGETAKGSASASTVAAAPIAIEDLCPVFTKDLCTYLMQCGGARYKDAAHCEQELDCFGMQELLASAASHRVTYDPSKVGACHERFVSSPCTFGFFLFTPDIFEVLSYCPGTLEPNQGAGDECVSYGECQDGLYCYKGTDYQCPGTCREFGKVGDSCAGSGRCAEGLTCGTGELCEPETKAGDECTSFCNYSVSCEGDEPCNKNLYCDRSSNTCQTGRLEGEVCGTLQATNTSYTVECAIHLWCNALGTAAGTCQRSSTAGGPCNNDTDACVDGLHCTGNVDFGTAATLGTCVGPSASGGNCRGTADCQTGLVCTSSICRAPAGLGENCYSSSTCALGLTCRGDVCVTARYPGDTCNDTDLPCVYSRCVNGTCQYHAGVGEACAASEDCATGECVKGVCYDDSVCNAPVAATTP